MKIWRRDILNSDSNAKSTDKLASFLTTRSSDHVPWQPEFLPEYSQHIEKPNPEIVKPPPGLQDLYLKSHDSNQTGKKSNT